MKNSKEEWFLAFGTTAALPGLKERGIDAYVPMETRWHRLRARSAKVNSPLFGRYLFIRIPLDRSHAEARSVAGVVGFVKYAGAPLSVPASWIAQLRIEEARGDFDKTRQVKVFTPGQPVKITRGVFQGYTAAIVRTLTVEGRVKLMFNAMGMKGSATLDIDDVAAA